MMANKMREMVCQQRDFFKGRATLPYEKRLRWLRKLKAGLALHEGAIHAALKKDLGRPVFESYITETGFVQHDLTHTIKNLKKWMRTKRVKTPLLSQPASSRIQFSPLGVTLIIAPFNYPFALAVLPMIAAIAAGNTVVLKASELAPATSALLERIIGELFEPCHVAIVSGAIEETTLLLQQRFDHIFFTGSTRVGSIVMKAAAEHLTPVTLELGGKSPCIVHHDARLDIAVSRICYGKFLNAGQTCVAPDYILVHGDVKEPFLERLRQRITDLYGKGEQAAESDSYSRMINEHHHDRVVGLIDPTKVIIGGQHDRANRFIAPTVMDQVTLTDAVMTEEIFGPVLPVLEYNDFKDIYETIDQLPHHPLACYLFSESRKVQEELTSTIQFGGGCINHCVQHLVNPHLPFGGVGQSGMGSYHGFHGFKRFSHKKGILKASSRPWSDAPLVYPPYSKKLFGLLDKFTLLRRLLK